MFVKSKTQKLLPKALHNKHISVTGAKLKLLRISRTVE